MRFRSISWAAVAAMAVATASGCDGGEMMQNFAGAELATGYYSQLSFISGMKGHGTSHINTLRRGIGHLF